MRVLIIDADAEYQRRCLGCCGSGPLAIEPVVAVNEGASLAGKLSSDASPTLSRSSIASAESRSLGDDGTSAFVLRRGVLVRFFMLGRRKTREHAAESYESFQIQVEARWFPDVASGFQQRALPGCIADHVPTRARPWYWGPCLQRPTVCSALPSTAIILPFGFCGAPGRGGRALDVACPHGHRMTSSRRRPPP